MALPSRSSIATREFLVFNQELATLLKAGMPLVQSLDILRRRVTNPVFKSVLNDVYDRVRAGSSLSESFEAHGEDVSRRLHGIAAGGREERQPRAGHPPLRRLRQRSWRASGGRRSRR